VSNEYILGMVVVLVWREKESQSETCKGQTWEGRWLGWSKREAEHDKTSSQRPRSFDMWQQLCDGYVNIIGNILPNLTFHRNLDQGRERTQAGKK
jgi:hypothetical protein